jgi:glutathione-regulated potassium-efflux system ancillary protein KefF
MLIPLYEQTIHLCGMRGLPPLIVHGTRCASEKATALQFSFYREQLLTYPAWSMQARTRADRDPIGLQLQPGNPNDA